MSNSIYSIPTYPYWVSELKMVNFSSFVSVPSKRVTHVVAMPAYWDQARIYCYMVEQHVLNDIILGYLLSWSKAGLSIQNNVEGFDEGLLLNRWNILAWSSKMWNGTVSIKYQEKHGFNSISNGHTSNQHHIFVLKLNIWRIRGTWWWQNSSFLMSTVIQHNDSDSKTRWRGNLTTPKIRAGGDKAPTGPMTLASVREAPERSGT